MRLYFIRHGETDWNRQRRIQGQADIPLNAFGVHIAKETAKGLKDVPFDLCITSPLNRARETARIILRGRETPIFEDDRIGEMAFGAYEGKCCSPSGWELPDNFHSFFCAPEKYDAPPRGESFFDVRKRTGEFLKELLEKEEHRGKNLLIATHGAALAGILSNIKGLPISRYWEGGVHKNCGVTEVSFADGALSILSENRVYYREDTKKGEEL